MDPNFKNPAIFAETNEPATPGSGYLAVYAATDGTLRYKNDGGVVNNLGNVGTTFTSVNSNSANWNSSYTTVNTNSATTWNYQGTDIKALTANWQSTYTTVSSNSASWGGGSGSGLTIFQEISSVVSPNDTRTVHAFSVSSSVTDVDIALVAKGSGATIAQIPNNVASGGNKRGEKATDFQKGRTNADEVASGIVSVICGGSENKSAATGASVVGGSRNKISLGNYSFVGGGADNTINGTGIGQYSSILAGQNNTITNLTNTHIIGSDITATIKDYTYVNNLSSQGVVAASGGNSNTWNSAYTTVQSGSAAWSGSNLSQAQVLTRIFFKI